MRIPLYYIWRGRLLQFQIDLCGIKSAPNYPYNLDKLNRKEGNDYRNTGKGLLDDQGCCGMVYREHTPDSIRGIVRPSRFIQHMISRLPSILSKQNGVLPALFRLFLQLQRFVYPAWAITTAQNLTRLIRDRLMLSLWDSPSHLQLNIPPFYDRSCPFCSTSD